MHGRPPNSLVPSACRGPKFIGEAAACYVNKPISTWEKFNSSLSEHGRGQSRTPLSSSNPSSMNVYMMKCHAYISTRAQDYGIPSTYEKSKEAENPPLPLQIEKTLGKKMTCIPKGVFKKASHNPNARVA
jgi:hypothetical protein